MSANSLLALLLIVLIFSSAARSDEFQGLQNSLEERFSILEKDFKTSHEELYSEVRILKTENQELKSAKATLEERVVYLEAIKSKDVPRTCHDLKNLAGVMKSGSYLVDPDGPALGDAPISVFCDMDTGTTIILHDLDGQTVEVEHCEGPGCHKTVVNNDATVRQVKALVDLSHECTQDLRYDCFEAPPLLKDGNISMACWVGPNGQPNIYWEGSHDPSTHTCACGHDGSCIHKNYPCNCDNGLSQWTTDAGTITNMASVPVAELRFGGLVHDRQKASFELGPLVCSGKKEFRPSESCQSLRLAGHSVSGYYMVDGTDGLDYKLVFCDMEKESDDPGLETSTAIKLPEYPVSFDATDPDTDTAVDQVIAYRKVLTNQGNAFRPETGAFVTPLHGGFHGVFHGQHNDSMLTFATAIEEFGMSLNVDKRKEMFYSHLAAWAC